MPSSGVLPMFSTGCGIGSTVECFVVAHRQVSV